MAFQIEPRRAAGEKAVARLLLIPGVPITIIGIAHIPLPLVGYDPTIASAMAESVRDHFYYLATWAICAFLLGMGALTIYFSQRGGTREATRVFAAVMLAVWLARLALEFLFPVRLSLYGVKDPGVFLPWVIATIVAGFAGYLLAARAFLRRPLP